jgi:uncharacterized protein (DUF169 family)
MKCSFRQQFNRLLAGMNVEGLAIPACAVKFYFEGDPVPREVLQYAQENISITSCQANRQAGLGDAVYLTAQNIGCIAAAITFGLVDQHQKTAMQGSRVYTDIMKNQSENSRFAPPSPEDFTEGIVYACRAAGKKDFHLFGPEDSGRFKTVEIAKKAVAEMMALQPAKTAGVFFFAPEWEEIAIEPDVVTMDVRPVELTRIVQAYQFLTGERVTGDMGPVRVVNSDLIVRPYLTGKINFASYCVGARLIGQYTADRLGIGIPGKVFETVVQGMEESRTGYPFEKYPGASGRS